MTARRAERELLTLPRARPDVSNDRNHVVRRGVARHFLAVHYISSVISARRGRDIGNRLTYAPWKVVCCEKLARPKRKYVLRYDNVILRPTAAFIILANTSTFLPFLYLFLSLSPSPSLLFSVFLFVSISLSRCGDVRAIYRFYNDTNKGLMNSLVPLCNFALSRSS